MGEYATFQGQSIKIGTCENMYYLRADQRAAVRPEAHSVDPVKYADQLRFRFPWPDEDDKAPGDFDDPFRSLAVDGAPAPALGEMDHGIVQFVASAGYNVCLPCPEGAGENPAHGLRVARNGFSGAVHIVQQRFWHGHLITVAQCGGCGAKYRLENWEMAEPVVVAIRAMADREQRTAERNNTPGNSARAERLHLIADRIAAGYPVAAYAEGATDGR